MPSARPSRSRYGVLVVRNVRGAVGRGHDLLDDLRLPGLDDATVVFHYGASDGWVVVNLPIRPADDLLGRLAHGIAGRRVGQ